MTASLVNGPATMKVATMKEVELDDDFIICSGQTLRRINFAAKSRQRRHYFSHVSPQLHVSACDYQCRSFFRIRDIK